MKGEEVVTTKTLDITTDPVELLEMIVKLLSESGYEVNEYDITGNGAVVIPLGNVSMSMLLECDYLY